MTLFLFFFSLFFNPTIAQVNLNSETDHVLVHGTGGTYHVLTPEGYYNGSELNLSEFKIYSDSTKVSTPIPLREMVINYVNDTPYLIAPIDGFVYQFKDDQLKRIDQGLRQANDYAPLYFTYEGYLYSLGGNIVFNHRNSLRVFNHDTNNWELVTTSGTIPEGIKNAFYSQKDQELWVYHAHKIDNDFNESILKNAYSLDLKTLEWRKRGIINPLFMSQTQNIPLQFVSMEQSVELFDGASATSYSIDLNQNTLTTTPIKQLVPIAANSISVGPNQWLYTTLDTQGAIAMGRIDFQTSDQIDYFIRDERLFKGGVMGVGISSILMLFVLLIYILANRRKFKLTQETLSNGLKKIPLSDEEVKFLKILAQKKIVLNNEAMDIIHDPSTTYDANIKRKNNLVSKIERKLKKTFHEVLFTRERYKDDMRHTAFYLKNGYSIKCLNIEDE